MAATKPQTMQAQLVSGQAVNKSMDTVQLILLDGAGNPVDIDDILSRLVALETPEAPETP